jgi:hypothetical protein
MPEYRLVTVLRRNKSTQRKDFAKLSAEFSWRIQAEPIQKKGRTKVRPEFREETPVTRQEENQLSS